MKNLIFDKGLETEVSIPVKTTHEHLSQKSFNADCQFEIGEITEEAFEPLFGRELVHSLDIENEDGEAIVLVGNYTRIVDFTLSTFADSDNVQAYSLLMQADVNE